MEDSFASIAPIQLSPVVPSIPVSVGIAYLFRFRNKIKKSEWADDN